MRHGMVATALLAGQRVAHQRHAHYRVRGALSLVPLVARRSRQCLLHRLAGEHAERTRDARIELHLLDAPRRLAAHVVVVIRLAADHRTEAGNAGKPAGLGAPLRGEGQLEGAGDLELVHRGRADATVVEALDRAVQQALRQLAVEGPDADREFQATQQLPLGAGELLDAAFLSHLPALPAQPPLPRAPRALPRAAARS